MNKPSKNNGKADIKNNKDEMHKVGHLIREIRSRKNITQADFASRLKTSQSAVARIENGEQNLTIEQIAKISEALEHPLVQLSTNWSDDFKIHGGRKLSGQIETNTSKNGAMGLLCASLLNMGTTVLRGIPKIEEVSRLLEVFESIGVKVKWFDTHSVEIKTPKSPSAWTFEKIDRKSAEKMRTTLMLIGPMIHRIKKFNIPHSGGCNMGQRTINAHRLAFEKLGVKIATKNDKYEIQAPMHGGKQAGRQSGSLPIAEITMYEASDTATENILMGASLIKGRTIIHFAQENYMVQDIIGFLKVCGVKIERVSISTIIVHGVDKIDKDIEYYNSEDPIESMAFITAGIMTKSKLTITKCPIDFIRLETYKLELMGQKFLYSKEYLSKNGFTKLVDITVIPSELQAPKDKLHPLPYPGINVDNLPFFVPICTQADGTTLINDWMWENRAIYFTELNRLGANITLADPHRVFVQGKTPLKAAQIVCPPALRPSMIIFIAMLGAPGVSTLRNVYSINRGYENIAERLNAVGAKIERLTEIA